jgi:hypothetical protein
MDYGNVELGPQALRTSSLYTSKGRDRRNKTSWSNAAHSRKVKGRVTGSGESWWLESTRGHDREALFLYLFLLVTF